MDDVDSSDVKQQQILDAEIATRRNLASQIGEPTSWTAGICNHCESHTIRLVRGLCARCRDKVKP